MLTRYIHTLKYLQAVQLAYQLRRRFGPKPSVSAAKMPVIFCQDIQLPAKPSLRKMKGDENSFIFLNIRKEFDPYHFDWSPRGVGKLWRYNLHYFDYLGEENRPVRNKKTIIESWIKSVPRGSEDAWEPFPTSLRIVNWIKWFLSQEIEGKPDPSWAVSLYEQVLWLEKNIEYHLLANHLFKNGKALVFAGVFFEGVDAKRWLKKGLKIVLSQLNEQILSDGGHFERSPMYHAMILEDCLDLMNLCRGAEDRTANQVNFLRQTLQPKVEKMTAFLRGMTHPDGQISLFNDAAMGIEAKPEALFAYDEQVMGRQLKHNSALISAFPETGYFIMSPRPGDRMIIDCGPVGPDYQPGHSHCDTLSFELSLKGRRVVVDSGCCRYEDGLIRQYNRGSIGHNSVIVDKKNQSEIWGAHRCARRAQPINPQLYEDDKNGLVFEGGHDGYRRLVGRPIHYRRIVWRGNEIWIDDRIEGRGQHFVETRLHIHPNLQVELETDVNCESVRVCTDDELCATISAIGQGRIQIKDGWYCPEFGVQEVCRVICTVDKVMALPVSVGWRLHIHN